MPCRSLQGLDTGPHGAVPGPVLDATFPRSLKQRARNIVLRERARNTNTQDNYDHPPQPTRCPVHSRRPAVAKPRRFTGQLARCSLTAGPFIRAAPECPRHSRIEGVVVTHIYPSTGILAHDLPALLKPATEYFPFFWYEIRSPIRHFSSEPAKIDAVRPEDPFWRGW